MHKLVLFLIALCLPLNAKKSQRLPDYEAYYWKDFALTIPSDALIAGRSENKEPVYIVQVLHKSLLIPGKLDKYKRKALYEYNNSAWSSDQNIKILCTNFPSLFEWHQTDHLNFVNDKNYIAGGYDGNRTILIGKANYEEDLLVGKVEFHKNEEYVYLYTAYKGKSLRLQNYKVLLFTPLYLGHYSLSSFLQRTHKPSNILHPYDVYHWRDFTNTIPSDAFHAGSNKCGKSLYIVQVLLGDKLIHGSLDVHPKQAIYEYEKQQWNSSSHFKILCSHYPQYLVWQTPSPFMFCSKRSQNVVGGYELNRTVYIGKGTIDHQYVIGKVLARNDEKKPLLHTIYNGEPTKLKCFKILVCELPNKNKTALDVTTPNKVTLTTDGADAFADPAVSTTAVAVTKHIRTAKRTTAAVSTTTSKLVIRSKTVKPIAVRTTRATKPTVITTSAAQTTTIVKHLTTTNQHLNTKLEIPKEKILELDLSNNKEVSAIHNSTIEIPKEKILELHLSNKKGLSAIHNSTIEIPKEKSLELHLSNNKGVSAIHNSTNLKNGRRQRFYFINIY